MKRGSNMPPYRERAGGYATFPNPDLYANKNKSLNNLARFANNTQITLQPGQVGRPLTKPFAVTPDSCEVQLSNGMPAGAWCSLYGDGSLLPKFLGGVLTNTFAQNGTTSHGANCRQRGGKWVQAGRQWHGSFPWTSECADVACSTFVYKSYHSTAEQTKYLTLSADTTFVTVVTEPGGGIPISGNSRSYGSMSADAQSGKITGAMHNSETLSGPGDGGSTIVLRDVTDGYDSVTGTNNNAAVTDNIFDSDVHCSQIPMPADGIRGSGLFYDILLGFSYAGSGIADLIAGWNSTYASNQLGAWDGISSYSSSATAPRSGGGASPNTAISIDISIGSTSVSVTISIAFDAGFGGPSNQSLDYSASWDLSNANTSASVKSDVEGLLNYWDLSDDALYPFRTDGLWQIAPFVSREEAGTDISPVGVGYSPKLDDKRSPVADINGNNPFTYPSYLGSPPPGWTNGDGNNDSQGNPPGSTSPPYLGPYPWQPTYTQMAWFDPDAFGFIYGFDATANKNGYLALDYKQYALTGKVLGMPLPRALTDGDSYWYDSGAAVPGGNPQYEDFFDYRNQLWKACDHGSGEAGFYQQGLGEWLSDAIARTGAQLPFCCTQWTNNLQAKTLPPYAYLINYDKQVYPNGGGDILASLPSLFAQKCCEIVEIWPSQNFFRPAGADKFVFDETKVYCVTNASGSGAGSTWNLTDNAGNTPADGLDVSGTWGGPSVSGFYTRCTYSGGVVTLVTLAFNVPSDWPDASGDGGVCFGKLRFPTVPSLLGRVTVTAIADGASHAPFSSGWTPTYQFATPQTNFGMSQTTSPVGQETVDFYDASMTLLSGGGATATRATDSTFTSSAGYPTAAYVMIHGAPDYKWDDNLRKGDFAALQWLMDYRTAGEITRLAGVTDCAGNNPPSGGPTANNGYQAPPDLGDILDGGDGNTLTWSGDNFQAQGTIHYTPCSPCVVCCSPNGETFPNGITIPFPTSFDFDSTYGSRWQLESEQAMQDILWQGPHRPCGLGSDTAWTEDDGTCQTDGDGVDYFAHRPYVEARTTLPAGAPTLPSGVTVGNLNPVDNSDGLTPPGWGGFDINTGNPTGFWTWWGYRYTIETLACQPGTCIFDYVGMENLACLSLTTSSPAMIQDQPLSGLGGLS